MTLSRAVLIGLAALGLATSAAAQGNLVGTLAPYVKWQVFDNNGDPCASCRIFVYDAGTSTKKNTWNSVNLVNPTLNTNPITLDSAGRTSAIYLAPNESYKFVLCAAGSDDPCSSPIWTQDNAANVPANTIAVDIAGTAGEDLFAGLAVYMSDGSGGKTAGRWYHTDADQTYSSTTANAIGAPPADILTGASGLIRIQGRIEGGGFSAGTILYLSTGTGQFTSTAPANARLVAVADSSSTIILTNYVTGADQVNGIKTFISGAPLFLASGVASNTVRTSGRLTSNTVTANVGNVGAGEDNLQTTTLPAGTLSNDGMVLRVTASGTFAANATAKHVRCYFGATAGANSTSSTAYNGISWRVVFDVIRTGATTQDVTGGFTATQLTVAPQITSTTAGETLANAITVKCTGEAGADNDIIQSTLMLETVG